MTDRRSATARRRRAIGVACVLAVVSAGGCGGAGAGAGPRAATDLAELMAAGDATGFAQATEVPALAFPRDHGSHPAFRTEWWYWTGNVAADDGRAFGFQLVFFRHALAPAVASGRVDAALAARELVLAHAALGDVRAGVFASAERLQRRDGVRADVSGDGDAPELRWFCADWSASTRPGVAASDDALPVRLVAGDGDWSFDLEVGGGRDDKRPVPQGDGGLSRKGDAEGNASIYYSLPRLRVAGAVVRGGERIAVRGAAWCDREWSTSALSPGQVGWDWFALQLDDGSDLMWYRLRRRDGTADPRDQGSLVAADGTVERLRANDLRAVPDGSWRAADGRAVYPARWRIEVPRRELVLDVVPRIDDQELRTGVRYWEGAVEVRGTRAGAPVAGLGFVEMTGYAR